MTMRKAAVSEPRTTELERVYREDGERLWRSLLLFCGDGELASDAVAEAFAQALHRGDEILDVGRWVWKSSYRIAAGELKRRRRTSGPVPETGYEIPDAPLELSIAMRSLSPMQRAAVTLHDYAGYKLREVAEITGSTTSAVGVHVTRGRQKLRKILEESADG